MAPRQILAAAAAAESPPAPQRSTSPYSILRSPGRLKIVASGGVLSDRAMSIARRVANDLFAYFKLDADIVHETEILEAQHDDFHARMGTGNIVVIGSPSGRYIRQCLAKGKTAFTIAESDNSPPVLQLKGETLSGLSQGNLVQGQKWSRLHRGSILQGSCSHIHTNPHLPPPCCS